MQKLWHIQAIEYNKSVNTNKLKLMHEHTTQNVLGDNVREKHTL